MKHLKKLSTMLVMLTLVWSSCKKDKDGENKPGSNNYEYQGRNVKITLGDYRSGNGDGAWIYFSGEGYTDFVQMRFAGLADYTIPAGTFTYKSPADATPYNPAKNFKGGQVIVNNVADEINGGTITVEKKDDSYTITFNVTTAKGPLTGKFSGVLQRI
jgi:hypothetical protein